MKGLGTKMKGLGTKMKGLGTKMKGLGTKMKGLGTKVKGLLLVSRVHTSGASLSRAAMSRGGPRWNKRLPGGPQLQTRYRQHGWWWWGRRGVIVGVVIHAILGWAPFGGGAWLFGAQAKACCWSLAVEELKAGRWSSAVNVNWRRVFTNEMIRHEAQRVS